MSETLEKKWKPQEELIWDPNQESTVVLAPKNGAVHELNGTASWIWNRLDGAKTGDDLVREFCEEFDVNPKKIEKDMNGFFLTLHSKGMIQ